MGGECSCLRSVYVKDQTAEANIEQINTSIPDSHTNAMSEAPTDQGAHASHHQARHKLSSCSSADSVAFDALCRADKYMEIEEIL